MQGGRRKVKYHQYLKADGIKLLDRHMWKVIGLMDDSKTWKEFYQKLEMNYPVAAPLLAFNFAEFERGLSASERVYQSLGLDEQRLP